MVSSSVAICVVYHTWTSRAGGGKESILIDAGLGVHDVRRYIHENGLVPEDGKILTLATHVHFDHSGGLH